jgi:hypothetical protein
MNQYILAFIMGGAISVVDQLLIDLTSLTPARILVSYVVSGVALYAVGECSMHYLADVEWLMWSINAAIFLLFGAYAVRREGIDVGGLVAHTKGKMLKR